MEEAFLQEAHAALGARAAELDARLRAQPPRDEPDAAAAGRAFPLRAMRSRQRHLALALPPLPQVGFPAQSRITAAFDEIADCGRRPRHC